MAQRGEEESMKGEEGESQEIKIKRKVTRKNKTGEVAGREQKLKVQTSTKKVKKVLKVKAQTQ